MARVRVGYRTLQLTLGICCMVTLGIAINLTFMFSFPVRVRVRGRILGGLVYQSCP